MSGHIKCLDVDHESLAINNTPFRRILTLLALKTTARTFRRRGLCVPISKHLLVKWGRFVNLTEAATMKFLTSNTSIPVPKVWCSFVSNGFTYIVMERIHGKCLGEGWGSRSQESKDKLLAQLRHMIQELRSLQPPPGTGVESCAGGTLYDCRMPRPTLRFGPFKTIQDFHLWLRGNLNPSEKKKANLQPQDAWNDVVDMAVKQDGLWPPPVFTHGDLHPGNILVRGDEIVGLIDWEFSGWYPHYWEYTSAWSTQILMTEWQNALPSFLETFPEELKMEMVRQRWWGEV